MNKCFRVSFLSLALVGSLITYSENKTTSVPTDTWNATARYAPQNKVAIKVFYETLCPGSTIFFVRELQPAVENLAPYLDIHLVPYGFARTRETSAGFAFTCQHGQDECFGNRVHACVLDQLANRSQAALLNACLMNYYRFSMVKVYDFMLLVWCQHRVNVDHLAHKIWACTNSDRSSQLLKSYGDETRAWRPPFMPYVAMYDTLNGLEEGILGSLMSKICSKLDPAPPPCYSLGAKH